jgi:hypothetical protein
VLISFFMSLDLCRRNLFDDISDIVIGVSLFH